MQQIDANTAAEYLRQRGHVGSAERVEVAELAGGISNCVLYVHRPNLPGGDFVLKQARPQLRTPDPWYCTVERIWREARVLEWCGRCAPSDVPTVLFEDRDNYLFAMTAAMQPFETWKDELLRGEVRKERAQRAGQMLSEIHAGTWDNADAARDLADRTLFHELRIEPYYRSVIKAHPDAAADFERLIASLADNAQCLVHADFAPKNLLVSADEMMLVDFETGHFGDPAFDLGFFLSHLMLKAFHRAPRHEPFFELTEAFWRSYEEGLSHVVSSDRCRTLEARGNLNFAGCAWSRLDGTSKVDYLRSPSRRDAVRALCRWVLNEQPPRWRDVLREARARLAAGGFL